MLQVEVVVFYGRGCGMVTYYGKRSVWSSEKGLVDNRLGGGVWGVVTIPPSEGARVNPSVSGAGGLCWLSPPSEVFRWVVRSVSPLEVPAWEAWVASVTVGGCMLFQ